MTLITIFLMAIITFTTRYLFIHPSLPLRLKPKMVNFLSFSAPAVLTAIWVPIIFVQDDKINLDLTNPYFTAAVIGVAVSAKTKSVYWTVGIGILVFIVFRYFIIS